MPRSAVAHRALPSELLSQGADTLSDVLRAVRLSGALFFLVDARSPWTAEAPEGRLLAPVLLPRAAHVISYHVITAGSCWCAMPGRAPVRLRAGDVVVIPHGHPYALSTARSYPGSQPGALLPFFVQMSQGKLPRVVREGGSGPERIRLACGFMGCDALPFNPIVAALPPLVVLRSSRAEPGDRLSALIDFALVESRAPGPGSDCVLLRISELLFIELVRRYVAALPAEQTGWLAGLRDPIVGRALSLIHEAPARAWTLARLARNAGVSRSALAARFVQLVGEPPMHYLARWRMQVAARLLVEEAAKVSAVALAVGYESEASFSRAFKKAAGVSPVAFRNEQRPHGATASAKRDQL